VHKIVLSTTSAISLLRLRGLALLAWLVKIKVKGIARWDQINSVLSQLRGIQVRRSARFRGVQWASTRLGVLETWVLVSRRLETRFYKSWS